MAQGLLAAAALIYAALTVYWIASGRHHYELLAIGLQAGLLLPAFLFAFRNPGPGGGVAIDLWRWRHWAVGGFTVLALAFGFALRPGATFADETSYRFQAKVLAAGEWKAAPPPGGETADPARAPQPLAHRHVLVSAGGWYSKYPLLWPLVLALPERAGLGWMVTPLLGGLLLIMTGWLAREMFGPAVAGGAVWILALSPYTLSYSSGAMSHACCAVLIAGAACCCWRGVVSQRLAPFAGMLALLVLSLHVRIFTAFLCAAVFGLFALWSCRNNRGLLARLAGVSLVAAVVAVASVLGYNQLFTGDPMLSPYALFDGRATPSDVSPSLATVVGNLIRNRRFSMQTTWLYSFLFVFPLAAYGYWAQRASAAARMLAPLFPAVFLGYLIQPMSSAPIVGERYFYEAYFSVAILGALGLQELQRRRPAGRVIWAAAAVIQVAMMGVAVYRIWVASEPYVRMGQTAAVYRGCQCAVFLADHLEEFDARNLNLNTPGWRAEGVFYMNDPGEAGRAEWAAKFGWKQWVVLRYDAAARRVLVSASS
jgi:hypothetical protein